MYWDITVDVCPIDQLYSWSIPLPTDFFRPYYLLSTYLLPTGFVKFVTQAAFSFLGNQIS